MSELDPALAFTRLAQMIAGPTTQREPGVTDDPFVQAFTTGTTGMHGFETPGMGEGRAARGFIGTSDCTVWDSDGIPYLITHNWLRCVLETDHAAAVQATRLYSAIRHTMEDTQSFIEDAGIVGQMVRLMQQGVSVSELRERYTSWAAVSAAAEDEAQVGYTYNDSDNNGLTQEFQWMALPLEEGGDPLWDDCIVGLVPHTGVDARCGFAAPVFGVAMGGLAETLYDAAPNRHHECANGGGASGVWIDNPQDIPEEWEPDTQMRSGEHQIEPDHAWFDAESHYQFWDLIEHLPVRILLSDPIAVGLTHYYKKVRYVWDPTLEGVSHYERTDVEAACEAGLVDDCGAMTVNAKCECCSLVLCDRHQRHDDG